jgi:hypothetical protein
MPELSAKNSLDQFEIERLTADDFLVQSVALGYRIFGGALGNR